MKKMKRLLAIILASLLILSSATAGASAYQAYKDDALTKYDFTDSPVLTTEQYASMILDYADKALAKLNFKKDLPVIGTLDATSINNALNSVYTIGQKKAILNLAGDAKHLKVDMLKDRRRGSHPDVDVIKSLLEFLGNDDNRNIIKKVVAGGLGKYRDEKVGLDLGVANSFVKIDLNVEVMLRELIWGLAYPNTAYNSSTTVDTMVQTIIQNALAGVKEIPESVRNLVDLNSEKSTYDFIEDLLQTAYNDIAVPMLNDQTMKWLGQEIDKDTTGTLAGLFNRDFRVSTYTVPADSTLVAELNNIAGGIVNGLLKNYNGWVSGDNSKLTDNVVAVARYILKETGDYFFPDWQKHIATAEEIDAMSKEELIAYIARSVINASVGYMYIPEDVTTVVGVTWEAVKQLMAQFLPERDYSGYPKTVQGILDMLADYVAYNVNPGIDLNARDPKKALNYGDGMDKMLTTAVQWLADEPQNYTGLLPTTAIDTSSGWKALDDIFFKLLDKSILPAKFANSGSETILKDVVYSILNGLLVDQDLTCISDLFVKNESGAFATQTLKQSIVRLVTDILNAVLPGTVATKYASLNDIVKNDALSKIVYALLGSLNTNKKELVPPIVNIVAQVMGLSAKSKFGRMEFSGPTRVSDAYTVTIYNGSKGINGGYTDKDGNFTQDALYKYRIASVSATAYTAAGAGSNVGVSGVSAGDIINGGDSKVISVSKPGTADTVVVLTVGYYILTESGESLTGDTPVYASYYTYYCSDTVDDDSLKNSEASGNSYNKHSIKYSVAGFMNQNESINVIENVQVEISREKATSHDRDATAKQNASTFNNGSGAYFEDVMFSIVTKNEDSTSTKSLWKAKSGVTRADIPDGTYRIKASIFGEYTYNLWPNNTHKHDKTWIPEISVFVYNDYDVPAKYSQYSGEQRQRANYSADADAEWAAYQSALIMAANYALRPKLKANFSNATYMAQYKIIADNLDAAAAALDKKVVSASVDSLKTAVEAVQGAPNPEGSVYWDQGYNFFGYDDFNSVSWNGWKEARNRALNLYNSTIAPVEPVAPEKPGDNATLIEKQKYEKAYAQWQTDHAAWETAIAAWQMPTISAIDVAYAEQQIELWGPRLIKLNAVKTHLDAAIAMCTIDSADASKYDADRWEAYSKSFAYAQKVSTSFNASTTMRTQVREAMNNLIYNWKRLIANPVVTVTFTFTVNGVTHAVLTGNQGDPVDLSTIAAPDAPVGMHFVGWGNVPATFDADATFEAQFANNTDTKYTVNVYNMDTTGAYPSAPDSTYQGAGETGSTADITADAAPAEGFSLDSAKSVLTGTIAADGSLVLKVFYSRNQYTLTAEGVAYTFYYGAAVSVADPVKAHYTFAGWDPALPETMPAHDVTVAAKWTEDGADYSAYKAAVAAAQAKKAETDYDKTYTAETRAALAEALANDVAGKKYSEQSVVDAATKAINDAVAALKVMTYNAIFTVDGVQYEVVPTKVGEQIVAPKDPAKEGYVFKGWDKEVGKMGVEDITFTAQFEKASGIAYTVEVYTMDVNGNYGAAETKTLYGTTDAEVTADTTAAEGFTFDESAANVVSGKVAADGSLVLKVYFARNQYKLTVDGVESMVYYGAAISVAEPTKEHETFNGWDPALPETMPAHDVTVVSTWTKDDADYTEYKAARARAEGIVNDSEYPYEATYTAESRAALDAALAIVVPEGLKYDEQHIINAATKAINDAVAALELMTYTATFYVDGVVHATVQAKVGEQIAKPDDPTKTGYVFTGWNPEVGVMGTEDVSFNAQFTAGAVSYKVETYEMDVNGAYGAATVKTVPATTGEAVSVTPETREGFTVAGESVLTGKVKADSSLVLKVYYSRNQYKLTVDGAESMVYYGAELNIAEPTKDHYTFAGWNVEVPATMPASDLTLVSQWTEEGADYTAYNAAKTAAKAKQTEANFDKTYTAESRQALADALAKDVSGKKYTQQGEVDAATTAINDAVKALELETYTATFYVNGEVHATVTAKVGEQIAAPADPIVDGYNFTGWDPEVGTMGIENVRFDAILVASGSSIISVTPATPNYGGMHQYAVKVKGEPQKLRIVDAYGTTRTFDRNTSMTSDVNAFGILKIEKTEDGEIWTLNVNLVEGEYTALAKFDKAWEEDGYDFTVKFDTKPSEPVSDGVLDVTYNTPNYGGKQEYFVKVSGKADKIQIAYENGGTTTRARYDLRVSIKSYDAQGNEVDAKSANLAYEIWTVKLNIAEGKHVARAKYGKVWTGDHEFTVVYDVKPAPKGVVDVTYDTPNYGGKQQYSFKVDGKASKIQIAYGEGGTTTFIRIDPRVSIKSYDAQGNEVSANSADLAYEIWTVKLSIPEGKHLAKAKYGKTWTDGFEFDVVITSKPIKVVSVTAVSVSADSVAVTVNGTAKKVRITYASGATRTYDRDDIGVSIASNGDGEIWTINVKLTEGDYTATAKYMANGKQVWDTTDFAFTV